MTLNALYSLNDKKNDNLFLNHLRNVRSFNVYNFLLQSTNTTAIACITLFMKSNKPHSFCPNMNAQKWYK